jgi:hypothetical protein
MTEAVTDQQSIPMLPYEWHIYEPYVGLGCGLHLKRRHKNFTKLLIAGTSQQKLNHHSYYPFRENMKIKESEFHARKYPKNPHTATTFFKPSFHSRTCMCKF